MDIVWIHGMIFLNGEIVNIFPCVFHRILLLQNFLKIRVYFFDKL